MRCGALASTRRSAGGRATSRLVASAILVAAPVVLAGTGSPGAAPATLAMIVCAPGYPGTTEEAQPAMDALAATIAVAARWKPGELAAVYYEAEAPGIERLAAADAVLALVPLPFWLQHGERLALSPIMQAVEEGGRPAEPWTLVAPAGAVTGPSSLAGFELVSGAAYAPRFVRGPALGAWGSLPPDVKLTFSTTILTGLRRASAGARVALLLSRAEAEALPTLPFAKKLQVVTTSEPWPVAVVAKVGARLPAARERALVNALASLESTPSGADALAGVRLSRFVAVDQAALARARDAFDRVPQ